MRSRMSEITATLTRGLRRHLDLNQTAFAEIFGVDQSTVSRWEKGADMAPEYYSELIVRARDAGVYRTKLGKALLEGEISNAIPVMGYVGAGAIVNGFEDDMPIDYTEPPRADLEMVAVVVRGESMYPAYRDGDTVFFRTSSEAIDTLIGEECLIRTAAGQHYLKVLEEAGELGKFNLLSHNAPPIRDQEITAAYPVALIRRRRYA